MKKVYRKKLDAKAKAAKAKIQKVSGGDQFKNLKDWVAFYKTNDRLPSQKITCARCRVNQTSMFGDNLKRTLPKFGGVEGLLTKFECRLCRTLDAPVKEKKVKKERKVKEVSNTACDNTATDYITREDMEDRKDKVRATLPQMDPDAKPINIDLSDPEAVAELTTGACQRPDIYLDAGCFHCSLVKHCKAQCRVPDRSLDKGDRVKRSTGPKRK